MADLSVLVVDDDPICLHVLGATLEQIGLRVRSADRPSVALRLLDADAPVPDLLVSDLLMPEMSGLELVKAVRARCPGIVCLLITGFATNETIVDAFRAGAWDLMLKPVNVEELQTRVLHAAELVELRREVKQLRAARECQTDPATVSAPRARELTVLPSLPGSAAPLGHSREDVLQRLERLGALYRQGLLTSAEFEEKKQLLLSRV